jgi:UDP-N-acetylmuramoyl-L-alanyl-D-glutamate--2,6-diaminopimelate ligase
MRPFNTPAIALTKIVDSCNAKVSISEDEINDIIISGATHNDREVTPGDLFVAIPGANRHGAEFSESAKARGAVAVLTDPAGAKLISDFPVLVVDNPRLVAGRVSALALWRTHARSKLHCNYWNKWENHRNHFATPDF